jgi:hypothetical protein
VKLGAVETGDASRLLPAVLEGVEAKRDKRSRFAIGAGYAENAALLAQLVVIEGICCQHCRPLVAPSPPYRGDIRVCRAFVIIVPFSADNCFCAARVRY